MRIQLLKNLEYDSGLILFEDPLHTALNNIADGFLQNGMEEEKTSQDEAYWRDKMIWK